MKKETGVWTKKTLYWFRNKRLRGKKTHTSLFRHCYNIDDSFTFSQFIRLDC